MDTWKNIADSILNAFRKRNQKKLRKINDSLLKEAAVHFSKLLYELIVLSYVLSKVASKPRFLKKENEQKMQIIESAIENFIKLNSEDENEALENFKNIRIAIKSLEKDDPRFFIDLVSKGRLKVGATMYAQGVSLGTAVEMTGMNKQDILDYAGKTMMFDRLKEEKSIHDRLKVARKLISK